MILSRGFCYNSGRTVRHSRHTVIGTSLTYLIKHDTLISLLIRQSVNYFNILSFFELYFWLGVILSIICKYLNFIHFPVSLTSTSRHHSLVKLKLPIIVLAYAEKYLSTQIFDFEHIWFLYFVIICGYTNCKRRPYMHFTQR